MRGQLRPYEDPGIGRRYWSWIVGVLALFAIICYSAFDGKSVSFVDVVTKTDVTLMRRGSSGKLTRKSVDSVVKAVNTARDTFITQLKIDYGEEYFEKLFIIENGTSRGYEAFVSPPREDGEDDKEDGDQRNRSRARFERKLILKVLKGMARKSPETFVWATGGHSAAAGHGNLFNQSYTAYMTRGVESVFKAASINFEGRNYAMGGAPSAPELAGCLEAIYGLDADAITWDFGMTDVPRYWRKAWYNHRIARHPNRPIMVDMRMDSTTYKVPWTKPPRVLEDLGATAFLFDADSLKQMHKLLPDMFGLNQKQMDQMPEYVRHFKCEEKIEEGDPTCKELRFVKLDDGDDEENQCKIPGQVGWHPGWREHALTGNLIAFFLIDTLVKALERLKGEVDTAGTGTQELLDRFQKEEDEVYENLYKSLEPDQIPSFVVDFFVEDIRPYAGEILGAATPLCHTVTLPSQIRYKGYLGNATTNSTATSPYKFDAAFSTSKVEAMVFNPSEEIRDMILTNPNEQFKTAYCPTLIDIDYHQYYTVLENMGWTQLTVPHPGYAEEYRRKMGMEFKTKGLIIVCSLMCPWDECPEGQLSGHDLGNGLSMRVNGMEVTNMLGMGDNTCSLLEGAEGNKYFPSDNGSYNLQVKVDKVKEDQVSFFRLTSVIVV